VLAGVIGVPYSLPDQTAQALCDLIAKACLREMPLTSYPANETVKPAYISVNAPGLHDTDIAKPVPQTS